MTAHILFYQNQKDYHAKIILSPLKWVSKNGLVLRCVFLILSLQIHKHSFRDNFCTAKCRVILSSYSDSTLDPSSILDTQLELTLLDSL